MWPGYQDHMGWMGLWWIVALGALALVVWIVARAAAPQSRDHESPEAILKRRYARGELNQDEFERRLTELRK